MTMQVTGRELGVEDCDLTATGQSAREVVEVVVQHLRAEHDIDIPDTDVILEGRAKEDPMDLADPAVSLIVERLVEALNLLPPEGSEGFGPFLGQPL